MIERPIVLGSTNLTINDRAGADLSTSPNYWINVRSADGLYGEDERYESHPIPGGDGERSSTPLKAGKQIVLTGEIWAQGLDALRAGEEALQEAFWSGAKFQLKFNTWTSYSADPSNFLYYTVRKNQPLVIVDDFSEGKMKQNWTIGLRADDPRLYSDVSNAPVFSWQD